MLNIINSLLYEWLMKSLFWDKFYFEKKMYYHLECRLAIMSMGLDRAAFMDRLGELKDFPIQAFNKKIDMHAIKANRYRKRLMATEQQIQHMRKAK